MLVISTALGYRLDSAEPGHPLGSLDLSGQRLSRV